AVVASGRPDARATSPESTLELKQLEREVRLATERVSALTNEIDAAVEVANRRMRDVREHVIQRFVELPEPPAVAAPPPPAAPATRPLRLLDSDVRPARPEVPGQGGGARE